MRLINNQLLLPLNRPQRQKIYGRSESVKAYNESDERHDRNLRRTFGITHQDYLKLLEKQNYRCAICGATESDKGKRRLMVDHDHKTGKVRGLLCTNCNKGIGHLRDSVHLFFKAVDYLNGVD